MTILWMSKPQNSLYHCTTSSITSPSFLHPFSVLTFKLKMYKLCLFKQPKFEKSGFIATLQRLWEERILHHGPVGPEA